MMGGFQYMERQQTDMSLFWHSSRISEGDLFNIFCFSFACIECYILSWCILFIFFMSSRFHIRKVFFMSKKDPNPGFKPYVPASKHPPEFTWMSLFVGGILAIVFGAANAFLGLIVGMTVSASIPAAVISMAVLRIIMKRNSILENNIVQTITSSGEALAAGIIFTLPALFIWGLKPSLTTIAIIALAGGILGVILMIPLRR